MFSADLGVTPSASTLYADDVFSAYLYTGNGSTQTITNGIDLAGKGGLLWLKARSQSYTNVVFDTARGMNTGGSNQALHPETTSPQDNYGANGEALSNGFSVGSSTPTNQNGTSYVSWTFRKAPKFFDVVTYTGNGSANTVSHALGAAPGLIIIKSTSNTQSWAVYHRSLTSTSYTLILNGNDASYDRGAVYGMTSVTSSAFTVQAGFEYNQSGQSYVAYLFGHDTGTSGLIQCGSFTTDASGNASVTSLGWEPQFLLVKASNTNGDWIMLDIMRGWNMTSADALLRANLANAETTSTEYGNPTATGFDFKGGAASATYVYMAIRRPNKPPTSGSEVFNLNASAAGDAAAVSSSLASAGIRNVDMAMLAFRGGSDTRHALVADKLRGFKPSTDKTTPYSSTASTAAEATASSNLYVRSFNGLENHLFYDGVAGQPLSAYAFKRAPGFLDVVCYAGTGSSGTEPHNLGVIPELIIAKRRNAAIEWAVAAPLGYGLTLNSSVAGNYFGYTVFGTASGFYRHAVISASGTGVNSAGGTYVAYLFASLPGISKIGTYTGNGTTQTINCGFAAGARFVLIKRIDAAGDWYVWDTARGIVAATDPHLSLNSTAAEVTTDDSVDPVSSGFAVNQLAATNINVSSATYLYFAVS